MEMEMTLAEYKAKVDAKYANVRNVQEEHEERERERKERTKRKDHWLLVGPDGQIDGVMAQWAAGSAQEVFESFFPKKKERYKAAAEDWHIERDDINGSRWAAECEKP